MSYKIQEQGLTFDDLILKPKYSKIRSRSTVDLSVRLEKKGFTTTLNQPLIPANMKSIMGFEMASQVFLSGGMGILHRFMPLEDQIEILTRLEKQFGRTIWNHLGVSIGVKSEDYENLPKLIKAGVEIICIDIAHGDSSHCGEMTKHIAKNWPEVFLIAGNVATGEGACMLWKAGADAVKCGIGSGSLCSTRINTGNGVPQMTALMEVYDARQKMLANKMMSNLPPQFIDKNFYIISDGGAKTSGDLVKALCFADLVMTGNLFAGCKETCGNNDPFFMSTEQNQSYKAYEGSSTHKEKHIEGYKAMVPVSGTFNEVLGKLLDDIKSGLSYQGASNLTMLRNDPVFIRMSHASYIESGAHDVIVQS
jgi:IMP dehydrogenase